jgi:hypothetical protein
VKTFEGMPMSRNFADADNFVKLSSEDTMDKMTKKTAKDIEH